MIPVSRSVWWWLPCWSSCAGEMLSLTRWRTMIYSCSIWKTDAISEPWHCYTRLPPCYVWMMNVVWPGVNGLSLCLWCLGGWKGTVSDTVSLRHRTKWNAVGCCWLVNAVRLPNSCSHIHDTSASYVSELDPGIDSTWGGIDLRSGDDRVHNQSIKWKIWFWMFANQQAESHWNRVVIRVV